MRNDEHVIDPDPKCHERGHVRDKRCEEDAGLRNYYVSSECAHVSIYQIVCDQLERNTDGGTFDTLSYGGYAHPPVSSS